MRIRIVDSKPKTGEEGIPHLIGKEYEVVRTDEDGHYIQYGETGLYLINENEFEVIEEE